MRNRNWSWLVVVALCALLVMSLGCGNKKAKARQADEVSHNASIVFTAKVRNLFLFEGEEFYKFLDGKKNSFKYAPVVLKNFRTALDVTAKYAMTNEAYKTAKPVFMELDKQVKKYTNLGDDPEYQNLWGKMKSAIDSVEAAKKKYNEATEAYNALIPAANQRPLWE